MRIWDIDPGFLNDKSLLGEHVELHAIVSVIINGRLGYAHHPETLRWRNFLPALTIRHGMLAGEMKFRGFFHRSPLPPPCQPVYWPELYLEPPCDQYRLLKQKYVGKTPGRIPLPTTVHELWANHKYSVMARSPEDYWKIGPQIAEGTFDFSLLANLLPAFLRSAPQGNRLRNTAEHLWGYVAEFASSRIAVTDTLELLHIIQKLAVQHNVQYIVHSTALVELQTWVELQESGLAKLPT